MEIGTIPILVSKVGSDNAFINLSTFLVKHSRVNIPLSFLVIFLLILIVTLILHFHGNVLFFVLFQSVDMYYNRVHMTHTYTNVLPAYTH